MIVIEVIGLQSEGGVMSVKSTQENGEVGGEFGLCNFDDVD